MEASLRAGWAIPRRVLLFGTVLAAVLAGVFVGVLLLAGVPAALGHGMGFLAGTRPAISLTARGAMVMAIPIALAGAVGTGLREQP